MKNTELVQTRVSKKVRFTIEKLARTSGASVATWVRQLLIRETQASEKNTKEA